MRIPFIPFFLSLALFANISFGQSTPVTGQHTPASAAYKHSSNLTTDNFHPDIAAQTLLGADASQATELADQLKKVMDAYGLSVDTNVISTDSNFVDTLTKKNICYPFPVYKDIYLQKMGGVWYYSSHTVKHIPQLYLKVFPKGSSTIAHYLKKLGNGDFLGLEQWQWLGFLIIILGSVGAYFLSFYLSKALVHTLTKKRIVQNESSAKIIQSAAKMFSLIMAVRLVRQLYPLLLLPLKFNSVILMITGVIQIIFLGFLVYRIIDIISLIASKVAARTVSTLDDQIVPLARKLFKALIILFTFLLVLGQAGVNLTALLAGISIGGLALAFAAQDSVRNIFGSLMLLLDRPFQIGDQIIIPSIDKIEGTVEEVGLRSTQIRAVDNSIVTVPNGKLADAAINNLGLRILRRYKFELGISYDTPTEVIEQFVYGVRKLMQSHPEVKTDSVQVHFHAYDAAALLIRCSCYIDTQTFSVELDTRQELNLGILKLAQIADVDFASKSNKMVIEDAPWQKKDDNDNTMMPKYVMAKNKIEEIDKFIQDIAHTRKAGDKLD
jgi:MscS family membrane protein